MKIVFIAGQLTTGWDWKDDVFIEKRVKTAESFQIALINSGVGCFCPHCHTSMHHKKGSTADEKFYHELDLEFLRRVADAVLAMPDWDKSAGATKEIEWAIKNNLPIFYPKSPEDINAIIEWNKQNN